MGCAARCRELDRVLSEAGVVCGPIYTIADIFEDPQFKAREMLLEHDDPEFGSYIGPGIVPKFSEDAGGGALVGHLGGRKPQRGVFCGLLGLSDAELGGLRDEGVV